MVDYIRDIRSKVGHNPIILNFSGGILVNEKNKVLLQKRADFKSWGLPGGAIEFGETAMDACVREFKEEAGLDVKVSDLFGVSTNFIQNYPNGDKAQSILTLFLVKRNNKISNLVSDETLDLGYFDFKNLPKIFNEQHMNAINNYYSNKYPYFE